MPPAIATIVYSLLIPGLFWFDRDRDQDAQTSKALWIPVVWVSLACSRSPGQWLQMNAVPSPDQVLEGSPFDRLAYMLLLAAGLIVLVTRGQRVGKFLRANAVVLLFFLYCAVSFLWSDYPNVAFKRWTKALGDLVMVLIVLTDCKPTAALKRFLARTAYVLIPLSILFIVALSCNLPGSEERRPNQKAVRPRSHSEYGAMAVLDRQFDDVFRLLPNGEHPILGRELSCCDPKASGRTCSHSGHASYFFLYRIPWGEPRRSGDNGTKPDAHRPD